MSEVFPGFHVVNENNPPGSHPKYVTGIRWGQQTVQLDRFETQRLADCLTTILEQNSFEFLLDYNRERL